MPKETYIPCLFKLFRQYGYDGATLSRISQETGLGKASLYHHFPGGKDEMVTSVLEFLQRELEKQVLQPLRAPGDPQTRLRQMGDRLSQIYVGGQQPCLSAILLLGSAREVFHEQVRGILQIWIEAIAQVLIETGMAPALAHQRGEDALIAIQGSLIMSQGLADPSPFQRVIQQLPTHLLRSAS